MRNSTFPNEGNYTISLIFGLVFLPVAVAVFILSGPGGVLSSSEVVYEKESLYHYINVIDDGPIRALQFRKGPGANWQSAINLENPGEHVLEYTRMLFAGLAFVAQPEDILIIGLGGGIVPTEFRKQYPSARIDIVELDREVLKVAERFFAFDSASFNVHIDDGRVYMRLAREKGRKYDIIVLDAFNGAYIPPHLTTAEFLRQVFALLKENGCVTSNIHHRNRLYEYQQRTYAAVAPHNYTFRGADNTVVISTGNIPLKSAGVIQQNLAALQLEMPFTFDLRAVGDQLLDKPDWPLQGEILTDNYSPVNILNARQRKAGG